MSIGLTNPIGGASKIGISCEAGEDTYNNHTKDHSGIIYYKLLRKDLYAKYSNTSDVATIELFSYPEYPPPHKAEEIGAANG